MFAVIYVGSACVFATTFIAILALQQYFNSTQLIYALLTILILITLAEAFSPHICDSPLIYGIGGVSIIGFFLFCNLCEIVTLAKLIRQGNVRTVMQ